MIFLLVYLSGSIATFLALKYFINKVLAPKNRIPLSVGAVLSSLSWAGFLIALIGTFFNWIEEEDGKRLANWFENRDV